MSVLLYLVLIICICICLISSHVRPLSWHDGCQAGHRVKWFRSLSTCTAFFWWRPVKEVETSGVLFWLCNLFSSTDPTKWTYLLITTFLLCYVSHCYTVALLIHCRLWLKRYSLVYVSQPMSIQSICQFAVCHFPVRKIPVCRFPVCQIPVCHSCILQVSSF